MKTPDVNTKEKVQIENEDAASKYGTWLSIAVVAGVILVTYFVLFGLYMDRV